MYQDFFIALLAISFYLYLLKDARALLLLNSSWGLLLETTLGSELIFFAFIYRFQKAGNPAKASVRRLKKVKPPPRIAQHRSPASLSSPGISKVRSL